MSKAILAALLALAVATGTGTARAATGSGQGGLADIHVGYSPVELRAQMRHSSNVIEFFTTGKGYWTANLLRCRPFDGEMWGPCAIARDRIKLHTWLYGVAEKRLAVVVAKQRQEAAARAIVNLNARAEWDSAAARQLGWLLAQKRGWSRGEFDCIDRLWNDYESSWRVHADNPTSDAYGIPQALPGSKMGGPWQTDATQQITWGYDYVGLYGGPCGALNHRLTSGSY